MKTLKERAEIELAFANGEDVEYCILDNDPSKWYDLTFDKDEGIFDWKDYDYRIKQKARIFYFYEYADGTKSIACDDKNELTMSAPYLKGCKLVKSQEILE